MEKENRFKLKLSKIFTSSCKTQNLSEVIDHQNPIFTPQTPLMDENDPLSISSHIIRPKHQMMCKPRCPESFDQMIRENCIIPTAANPFPRRKIAGRYSLLSPAGDFSGRWCPPASPVSPLNQRDSKQGKKKKKKKKSKKDSKNEKTHLRNYPFSLSSSNETDLGDWFSSDDEREDEEQETETLFSSSKSLSLSDSEPDNPTRTRPRTRPRNPRRKSGLGRAGPDEVGLVPLQGKVKDTFAVVKSSRDPYNDFRTSMVDMIMEKQIFGAKELEQLLQCFLSLNSAHHHRVIVEVFTEILDALFSNCP